MEILIRVVFWGHAGRQALSVAYFRSGIAWLTLYRSEGALGKAFFVFLVEWQMVHGKF